MSTSPWFTASWCRDGSLAVIQSLRVQSTVEESSSRGRAHPRFASNVHAPATVVGIEEDGSCPIARAALSMLVGRDRSLRNKSIFQDKSPRWVGPHGPELVSMRQQTFSPAEMSTSGGDHLEFRLPCRSTKFQDSNRHFGTQRLSPTLIRSGSSTLFRKSEKRVGGKTLSLARSETIWKHSPLRAEVLWRKRLPVQRCINARPVRRCSTCSVDLASWRKREYDVTKSLVLTRIRQDVSPWGLGRGGPFWSNQAKKACS